MNGWPQTARVARFPVKSFESRMVFNLRRSSPGSEPLERILDQQAAEERLDLRRNALRNRRILLKNSQLRSCPLFASAARGWSDRKRRRSRQKLEAQYTQRPPRRSGGEETTRLRERGKKKLRRKERRAEERRIEDKEGSWKERRKEGRKDGRKEGWKEGRMEGRKDEAEKGKQQEWKKE